MLSLPIGALDVTSVTAQASASDNLTKGLAVKPNKHHEFALKQYSIAISHMRDAALDGTRPLRTNLLGCLLTICFETYHGNHDSALLQIKTGLSLLDDWYAENSRMEEQIRGAHSPAPLIIEDELCHSFARLEIQSMAFMDTRPAHIHRQRWMRTEKPSQRCRQPHL
jgi:hypothetical protein